MDMTPSNMGLAIGLAIGLIDYFMLTFMGRKLASQAADHDASPKDARKVERNFKTLALISLILFPIIGYFAGPYVFGTIAVNGGG